MPNDKDSRCTFYTCSCFTTENIFLEEFKLHVKFQSEHQFRLDYQAIAEEVERRQSIGVKSAERVAVIKEIYEPIHDHVYNLQESYLAPQFKQMVDYCRGEEASEEALLCLMQTKAAPRVYRFPVFNRTFCNELIEELEHFEQSAAPKGRPNTMNKYGFLLNELGFDEGFVTPLREQYLQPLTSLLYPDSGGLCLDSHKAFVVKYDMHEDLDLSYHYDNAEVTLNVSLGKEFTEGNLYFGDMREVPLSETVCTEVEHKVTEGLLHRGQHMHGALPISSGQRWNLIVWMRSSKERNKLCPMCNKKPTLVDGEGFADGFTKDSGSSLLQNVSCVLH
ncbi:2-oxoglutarate and iron-dependent oxygenase domain-containing protein 2 isoform X2 [Esox lucius]|uniref:2-oxoglutarate and iron-dependent oxygenase domain containing 2 n=1 Tax=Esox lucius TaxID=8010 RepID=A0A3P8ZIV5_ESOLU|nr:2-oxoglutarate and iron-dependent oxygenase domain-containing protein 2 isoform X2 [Esox lucius]